MMVEGDEKYKHIFSLGGWVQTSQQAKNLVIDMFEKPKLTIQEKVYVVGLWIFKGETNKPLELPLIVCLNDLISVVFYLTSLS